MVLCAIYDAGWDGKTWRPALQMNRPARGTQMAPHLPTYYRGFLLDLSYVPR